MVQDTQIKLTGALIMLFLFTIAIIGFVTNFTADTGAEVDVTSDLTNLDSDLSSGTDTFSEQSAGGTESIVESTIEPGSEVFQSSAPFSLSISNLKDTFKNIINLPRKYIFGNAPAFDVFFVVLGAFITLVLGLLIYKTLRGNP